MKQAHLCHCGEKVDRDSLQSFLQQNACGFSRHTNHTGLYRTDGKRPDGVTIVPWELDKQLI